jgi:cytochrome P450
MGGSTVWSVPKDDDLRGKLIDDHCTWRPEHDRTRLQLQHCPYNIPAFLDLLGRKSLKIAPAADSAWWGVGQSIKAAVDNMGQLRELGHDLLIEVQSRGPPADDDVTIGAHMLRLRDPATKQPLSQARLTQEFLAFLLAGSETTGYTIAWTLCVPLL